jgi:hypothetical protein
MSDRVLHRGTVEGPRGGKRSPSRRGPTPSSAAYWRRVRAPARCGRCARRRLRPARARCRGLGSAGRLRSARARRSSRTRQADPEIATSRPCVPRTQHIDARHHGKHLLARRNATCVLRTKPTHARTCGACRDRLHVRGVQAACSLSLTVEFDPSSDRPKSTSARASPRASALLRLDPHRSRDCGRSRASTCIDERMKGMHGRGRRGMRRAREAGLIDWDHIEDRTLLPSMWTFL